MSEIRWFGLVIAGLLVAALPGFALLPDKAVTQYTRTTWTQGEGLPADTIRHIAQTLDGFLWIGTNEGLARFDGHDFTVFGRANGALPSDFVTALAAAKDGSLWIGTPEGLVHYEGGRFTAWGAKEGLPNTSIINLYEDRASTLWIASGGPLSNIHKGSVAVIPAEKLAPLKVPRAFLEDKQGRLWISGAGGVIRREGAGFVSVLDPVQLQGRVASKLAMDRDGTLWIGTNQGILSRTADGRLHWYDTVDQVPNPMVHSLLVDRDGVLWAGTNGGLARLERGRFALQAVSPFHDRVNVGCLFEDREGNLWVGTEIGLSRFRDDRFTSFGKPEGWPTDGPTSALEDRKGDLWVGYHGSGLLQVSVTPASARPKRLFTVRDGLIGNDVFAVREARNGDLLIATHAGLSRMHDGHFQNTAIADPLRRTQVFDLLEDSAGRILLATSAGVLLQDGAGWRTLVPGGPIKDDNAVVLQQGAGGVIWAGTYGAGLWKITSTGNPRHFTRRDGLGSNAIRALLWDDNGILWIGTFGGGLIRFDGKSFSGLTTHDGLPSDNVAHIASDGAGYLWLSTTRGIARVAKALPGDHPKNPPVIVYGLEDGLRTLEPSLSIAAGGTRTRDGRLWFTTGDSLAVTDPSLTDAQQLLLGASLVEVSAGGKTLDPGREARLEPGAGPVELRFTGLHLRAPQSVRYEYRLDGLDTQWSAPTKLRSTTYNGLPHGTYRFRVRASLPGQPSPETYFAFVVLPRFYETAWFIWLCIATLAASVYWAYQWRRRRIHAQFALVIAERMRLAREIHDTLAQGFFGISAQLDATSLKLNDPDAARRELNLARRMARHSLAEARRSVMDLRASAMEEQSLSEALASAARQWTEGAPFKVNLRLGKTNRLRPDVEQNVLRIAQEAVTNAMKHARPSSIGIDLDLRSSHLILRVQDDGCGFDAAHSPKDTDGHFGLIGMRERAQRIGATFQVFSRPSRGTTVEVSVPV